MTSGVSAPDDGGPIRVVVSDDHPVVRQGLRSFLEARGFAVVGEAGDGDAAVRAVHRGEPMLASEAAAVVMARVAGEPSRPDAAGATHPDVERLTAREREVLGGLGRGLTNRQLADELFVSEKTIKTHVSSVLAKLRVADRTQAALFAVRAGVTDPRR